MQSNLNYTFFILSTFAVANPGTLGASLQVFFEALIHFLFSRTFLYNNLKVA
jgi:hypothetical protein